MQFVDCLRQQSPASWQMCLPDDITRHSPEGSTKDQTTVKGESSHSDGGVSPPFVANSRHDDRNSLEP